MEDVPKYSLSHGPDFKRILKRLNREKTLRDELDKGVEKILNNPFLGKPLRHSLRNYRRIHIEGSFVLLYEIQGSMVILIDFDHHDRIYKKYS
jgi:YafQ family addiction module toxin component